ncbi:MAG: uracil-DNA glycosylase [Gammaproteobacteria bacterium]|nr:uracil-DNA glycosylase [Gammaproteobacteria bacterium]
MSSKSTAKFNPDCRECSRLAGFLDQVSSKHPDYHARPVAAFGDNKARLLIIGLAPGMHGANASGRPFTGDFAGILLYQTLFDFGLSNLPESVARDDALTLQGCRITNAVKCLPPQNKPLLEEVRNCNRYLQAEIAGLPQPAVVMALGKLAHDAVLRALNLRLSGYPFGHARIHVLPDGLQLVDSYHCSRYNTQTRRLTPDMFADVFRIAEKLLDETAAPVRN